MKICILLTSRYHSLSQVLDVLMREQCLLPLFCTHVGISISKAPVRHMSPDTYLRQGFPFPDGIFQQGSCMDAEGRTLQANARIIGS